jgi:hypothetical protein
MWFIINSEPLETGDRRKYLYYQLQKTRVKKNTILEKKKTIKTIWES